MTTLSYIIYHIMQYPNLINFVCAFKSKQHNTMENNPPILHPGDGDLQYNIINYLPINIILLNKAMK